MNDCYELYKLRKLFEVIETGDLCNMKLFFAGALLDCGLKEKEGRESISNVFKYASKRLKKKEAAVQSMFD